MKIKAMVGIGTLIVFISAILVAAIGAGVILHTQNQLQNEALRTGADARETIGTSVLIESIKAVNIQNARTNEFIMRTKLGAGSSPINLNQTSISIVSRDSQAVLLYGGVGENNFFTNKANRIIEDEISNEFVRLRSDLDGDSIEDYMKIINSTTLLFNLSKDGLINVDIPDISLIGSEIDYGSTIGETNSHIMIEGTITESNVFNSDVNVMISPYEIGKGIYSIVYSIRGKEIDDALLFGDIIRIYAETSNPIKEGEKLSISFFTAKAVSHSRDVIMPSVLTQETVDIYP
jgi:archaellin